MRIDDYVPRPLLDIEPRRRTGPAGQVENKNEPATERAAKPHFFPRWLQEASVIGLLDFLLADPGTTPEALRRAKALRDQLKAAGWSTA